MKVYLQCQKASYTALYMDGRRVSKPGDIHIHVTTPNQHHK